MKRILLLSVFIVTSFLNFGQSLDIGLRAGVSFPISGLDPSATIGNGIEGFAYYNLNGRWTIGLEYGSTQFTDTDELPWFAMISTYSANIVRLGPNVNYSFVNSRNIRMGAGLGAGLISISNGLTQDYNFGLTPRLTTRVLISDNFGFNGCIPLNIALGGEGESVTFLSVQAGLFYRFDFN